MNILVVSGRAELWQSLRPQFEKRGASMLAAPTLDDALAQARELKGPDARVIVIPDGVNVVPNL